MSCGFCLTGGIGFKRNLKAHEIVDQIIAVMKVKSEELKVESSESKTPLTPLLKGAQGDYEYRFYGDGVSRC